MLGEVEGFSLALNYTTEDRRRQDRERRREKGWNNGTHCRSYLPSPNRCRPGCSLYCSTKGLLTKVRTQRHSHTHISLDKSMHSGFSNFPRCLALHTLGCVRWQTQPRKRESLTFCRAFLSISFPLFSFLCCFQLNLCSVDCHFICTLREAPYSVGLWGVFAFCVNMIHSLIHVGTLVEMSFQMPSSKIKRKISNHLLTIA